MGLFDKFKNKTIDEVVDTAKTAVSDAVKTGMDDKVRGLLYLLPMAAAGFILFKSDGKERQEERIPTRQVINNYYYYGEQVKPNVDHNRKSSK